MKKIIIGIIAMLLTVSCTNEDRNNATVRMYLTDAPAAYEEVLINIVDVQYHVGDELEESDTADGDWVSIDFVNDGIYNLLDFTNGLDTILAEASIPEGKLTQVRLVLAEEGNQVLKDGMYHDLKTPSAQSSGLKIKVNKTLEAGMIYEMWLDFDAARSIVETGNGKYILKPVIRIFTKITSGAISGVVSPVESSPYIMSISQDLDTVSTYADTTSGEFLIGGLNNGSYTVVVEPDSGFTPVTLNDVVVYVGEVNQLDTIYIATE